MCTCIRYKHVLKNQLQTCNHATFMTMCQSTPGAPTQQDLPQRPEPQIVVQPLGELASLHLYSKQSKSVNGFLANKLANLLSAHPRNLPKRVEPQTKPLTKYEQTVHQTANPHDRIVGLANHQSSYHHTVIDMKSCLLEFLIFVPSVQHLLIWSSLCPVHPNIGRNVKSSCGVGQKAPNLFTGSAFEMSAIWATLNPVPEKTPCTNSLGLILRDWQWH